jgi:hypothetical protein
MTATICHPAAEEARHATTSMASSAHSAKVGAQEFDLLSGVRSLPAVRVMRPDWARGISTLSLIFGPGPLVLRLLGVPAPQVPWQFLAVWAIPFVIVAAHYMIARRQWYFGPDEVCYAARGLLGPRRWSEPLSSYKGVLGVRVLRSGEDEEFPLTWHEVSLEHATRRAHSVELYVSRAAEAFQTRHREYAELFGLPRLVNILGEVTETRAPPSGESELPALDSLSRRGRKGLRFELAGDVLTVRTCPFCRKFRDVVLAGVFVVVWLGFLAYGVRGVLTGGDLWTVAVGWAAVGWSIVCFAFATLLVCDVFFTIDELEISTAGVRCERILFGRWRVNGGRLAASELEDILVNTALSGERYRTTVQFVGKAETLEFGYGRKITEEDKRILARCARTILCGPARGDERHAPGP